MPARAPSGQGLTQSAGGRQPLLLRRDDDRSCSSLTGLPTRKIDDTACRSRPTRRAGGVDVGIRQFTTDVNRQIGHRRVTSTPRNDDVELAVVEPGEAVDGERRRTGQSRARRSGRQRHRDPLVEGQGAVVGHHHAATRALPHAAIQPPTHGRTPDGFDGLRCREHSHAQNVHAKVTSRTPPCRICGRTRHAWTPVDERSVLRYAELLNLNAGRRTEHSCDYM